MNAAIERARLLRTVEVALINAIVVLDLLQRSRDANDVTAVHKRVRRALDLLQQIKS